MKTKLDALIEKYGTNAMSMTFRHIACCAELSPYMAKEVNEMTAMLEEALAEYAAGKVASTAEKSKVAWMAAHDPTWGESHNR